MNARKLTARGGDVQGAGQGQEKMSQKFWAHNTKEPREVWGNDQPLGMAKPSPKSESLIKQC